MTQPIPTMTDAELARLGIERVPAETFLVSGFRYTNLTDALAAARRAGAQ